MIKKIILSLLFFLSWFFLTTKLSSPERPENWKKINSGIISIYVPQNWGYKSVNAADSDAAEIFGDNIGVVIDYGFWSTSSPGPNDFVSYGFYDGHFARINYSKVPNVGLTEINFSHLPKNYKLHLFAENLNAAQQELVLRIFKTITFKNIGIIFVIAVDLMPPLIFLIFLFFIERRKAPAVKK